MVVTGEDKAVVGMVEAEVEVGMVAEGAREEEGSEGEKAVAAVAEGMVVGTVAGSLEKGRLQEQLNLQLQRVRLDWSIQALDKLRRGTHFSLHFIFKARVYQRFALSIMRRRLK